MATPPAGGQAGGPPGGGNPAGGPPYNAAPSPAGPYRPAPSVPPVSPRPAPVTPPVPSGKKPESTLGGMWRKIREDWIFNFSSMLAFNYLTATAPLALVGLAISGLLLSNLDPGDFSSYAKGLENIVPDSGPLIARAMTTLSNGQNAGALLTISLIAAVVAGSRLFVALENCFSVVYRVKERDFWPQNVMGVWMTLLYALLAPLAFVASGQLSGLVGMVNASGLGAVRVILGDPTLGIGSYLGRVAAGVFIAFIMFFAMYTFVPNRKFVWKRTWRVTWRGALLAAALLTLYEQLFPLYQTLFLRSVDYSSVAGELIVAALFLYFIGFITLLGAEINAWAEGMRPLGVSLPDLFRKRDQAGK